MKGTGNPHYYQAIDAHEDYKEGLKERAARLVGRIDDLITFSATTSGKQSFNVDLLLYYCTLYELSLSEEDAGKVNRLLADAFAMISEKSIHRFNPGISKGLSSLLYVTDLLRRNNDMATEFADKTNLVEAHCYEHARNLIGKDCNSFLSGSFGILFYFLNAERSASRQKYITMLLNDINERSEHNLSRFWIRNGHRDSNNEIDFSLAYGQYAYLMVMLRALEQGIDIDRNYVAITRGINYLLQVKQEIDDESNKYSFFPETVNSITHKKKYTNRLAWNSGDLNGALLLYQAADTLSNNSYLQVADIVGTSSLMRVREVETMCTGSGFYGGASGLAQLYKTLYRLRPLPVYDHGYTQWMERTMDHLENDLEKEVYKSREAEMLHGLIGVSLPLLSFIHDRELSWSGLYLM